MHIEILVEDSSGAKLVEILVPKIIGEDSNHYTMRIHPYKGIGRVPKGLKSKTDAAKRVLLDQLPRVLAGYANNPNIDAIVVIVDTDNQDCKIFLDELINIAKIKSPNKQVLFRLAIEEIEAWYLGDTKAIQAAYPKTKQDVLKRYKQDSVCGTWETLADAVYPGGSKSLKQSGGSAPGTLKHEWADKIGSKLNIKDNQSPSFCKFRDGLKRLVSGQS